MLPENNAKMPVVPQILSKTADHFIALAKILIDLGYDTINWNLGCPFPRVAQKMRGSGLLPHPERVDAFLEKVLGALPGHISVKARLGRQRPDEIFDLLSVFNRYPIKELIIHPRTGVQMYTGQPDLNTFEKCLAVCRCTVIYNGDINAREDFERLRQRFPTVHTWMIGRGAVSNPFLPGHIKGHPLGTDSLNRFRQFHDTLFERYALVRSGPAHLVDSMKGYWGYFARSFAKGEMLLKRVHKTQHPDQYRPLVARFFDQEAHDNHFSN